MSPSSSRRRFLAAAGATTTAAFAGCTTALRSTPSGDYPEAIAVDGWPVAGRDDAHTAAALDASPVDSPSVAWRSPFGLPPFGAEPAVAEGSLFVAVDGLRALDPATGETRWQREAAGAGAPSVRDGVVYVPASDGPALVGYDADSGESVLRVKLPAGPTSPPAFDHDGRRLVVGAGEHVCGVDVESGEVEWTREVYGAVRAPPAVNLGVVAAVTEAGELYALDVDGRALWRRSLDSRVGVRPVLGKERVYVAGRDGAAVAVGREQGDRRWRTSLGGFLREPMALDGRLLYVPTASGLHALDPATGEVYWRHEADDGRNCSAAAVDGVVYTTSGTGDLLALGEGGDVEWSLSLGRLVGYSLAAVDGRVYAVVMPENGPQRLVAVE